MTFWPGLSSRCVISWIWELINKYDLNPYTLPDHPLEIKEDQPEKKETFN